MAKSVVRTYSRYTREASKLIGKMIKLGRVERKITAQDLADRGGCKTNCVTARLNMRSELLFKFDHKTI